MDEYGENPIESMIRPATDYAAEKHGQLGKVGLGLLAVGLFVGAAPLAIAGGAAFVGSQVYKRFHAPTINNFLNDASSEFNN